MDKNGTFLPPGTMIQDSPHTSHVTFISQMMINKLATLMKIVTVGTLEKPLTYPMLCNLNFMTLPNIWQLTRSLYIPKKHTCLRIKIYRFCHTSGHTTWTSVMLRQKCATPDMTATHATVKQMARKVKGNDRKLCVYNFSSPQKLNHCDSGPNHMAMPVNFGRQENERGQISGKYGWWHDSNGFQRQISWYDMICTIWYTQCVY